MNKNPTPGRLSRLFHAIDRGVVPPADGTIRVLRQPADGDAAVLAFTAHIVIAADVEPAWAASRLPAGDLSGPLNPPFLAALCDRIGRRVNCVDMVTHAPALDGRPLVPLTEADDAAHPRISRARRYRTDVRAWTTDGGILVLGRGLAGRLEMAFEVDPKHQGRGLGRALARAARQVARQAWPDATSVWAQVSPGNAASVRTVLAAGYRPIGSEALLTSTIGEFRQDFARGSATSRQ